MKFNTIILCVLTHKTRNYITQSEEEFTLFCVFECRQSFTVLHLYINGKIKELQ